MGIIKKILVLIKQQKKWFYSLIFLSLLSALGFGLNRLYFYLTDDFTVDNISVDFSLPTFETAALSKEEERQLSAALKQTYHYLAKGGQMYALLSEDGKYVIKFFKMKHLKPNTWQNSLPLPSFLSHSQLTSVKRRKERLHHLFTGYQLAFMNLKKETGLVYIHLGKNKEAVLQNLVITDKLGLSHEIDLNQIPFVLQKKAVAFSKVFMELVEKHRIKEAKELFYRLKKLYQVLEAKKIFDYDHLSIVQNIGICNGEVLHLDPGQFRTEESISKQKWISIQKSHEEAFLALESHL